MAFIPQAALDGWVSSDKVDVAGDVVTLRGHGISLRLEPASFFAKLSAGSDAHLDLVGRVKRETAVAALGGEAYMTSVIVGDTAYDVEPGFLGTVVGSGDPTTLEAALAALDRGSAWNG